MTDARTRRRPLARRRRTTAGESSDTADREHSPRRAARPRCGAAGRRVPARAGRRTRRRTATACCARRSYLFTATAPDRRVELHVPLDPDRPQVPSLAGLSFPAGRFEREMRDLFGIVPADHPLPRRLVRHFHWPAGWYPMRADAGPPPAVRRPATARTRSVTVEGPGVYEIPVGPVHAGMIEPGHFRFSVVGETILKLKARLWFVHRGIEKLFEGRTRRRAARAGRTDQRRHLRRARAGVLPGRGGRPSAARCPTTPSGCARSCWSSNGSTTTSPTSARCATTSATASSTPTPCASANSYCASTTEVTGHRLLRGAVRPGGADLRRAARPRRAARDRRRRRARSWRWPWTTAWSATGSPAPRCSPPSRPATSARSATSPAPAA